MPSESQGESDAPRGESEGGLTHRVQRLRESAGISQRRLAEMSRIPQKNLSRIERGERDPTNAEMIQIATALDEPVSMSAPAPKMVPDHRARPGVRRVYVCLKCRRRFFLPPDPMNGGSLAGDFVPDCPGHGPTARQPNMPYLGQSTEPSPEQGWPPSDPRAL